MTRTLLMIDFLAKHTLKEKVIAEFEDLFETFAEFFDMIKSLTYDKLAGMFGGGATGIVFGMIFAILIMFIAMKIINR